MDPSQILFFQTLINGILLGGIYVVVSLGLSLSYGVLHIINVAHGEFVMLGAYSAYWLAVLAGLDPMWTFPIIFVAFFAVGYLLQKFIVNRIMSEAALKNLVVFFGLSILLSNLGLMTLGTDFKITTTPLSGVSIPLGDLSIPITRIVTFVVGIGILYVFTLFLKRSWVGKAIRATAFDPQAVGLMGVNVNKIYAIVLGLAIGVTAVSGGLVSSISALHPTMGGPYLIFAFLISVMGGMGYLPGTLAGGFTLGLLVSFINSYFMSELTYLIMFLLLWVLLLLRPKGIFGKGM
jgi:branched-chain amino acid transport system permease protein